MFAGIIEQTGRVKQISTGSQSTELIIHTRKIAHGLRVGSSVAVNGACLTVVSARNGLLKFDVLNETLQRTNLGDVRRGDSVNLERSVRIGSPLDGHFVLGHVDGTGKVCRFERQGADYVMDVKAPSSVMKYIVEKGSVALDGISLTVAGVRRNGFRVCIIPHTRNVTNLPHRRVGDRVNLEADIVGKYVEKLLDRGHKAGFKPSRRRD